MGYESYRSEIGDIEEAKKIFERERDVARLPQEVDLREGDNGSFVLSKRRRRDVDAEDRSMIVYTEDNCIHINTKSFTSLRYSYGIIDLYNKYLPDSAVLYEYNNQMFMIYEPDKMVRHNSTSSNKYLNKIFKIDDEGNDLSLFPDGKVCGAKIIKRGPSTEAEPKPLKEHLERKHYTKMATARLDNDLIVQYSKKWATFRGIALGLNHYCIELWSKKERYMGRGPNSGLIRRLHVGRFIDDTEEDRMNELTVEIVKDLPLGSLNLQLRELCESARGA